MSISLFDRQGILFKAAFLACVVSALALIWFHRFLPATDYPDWIFQGSIVARLVQGTAPASYTLKHYPVPNAAVVVLLAMLDFVFPPEASAKVVLSLCIFLMALSSTYLLTSIRRDANNPLLLIPLLYLPNTFFFWGELGYVFGLSLFFFYCGYLLRRVYSSKSINWWLISGLLVFLFFCHFIPYAIAVLVTVTFLSTESRSRLLRPFSISLAPSIGLTVWYALERPSLMATGPVWAFWTPHQFAGRLLAAFSPYPEFLPWLGIHTPGIKLFAILNLFVTVLLTLVLPLSALLSVRQRTRNRGVLACAIVCAFAAIASGYKFAEVVTPGERLLYPAVWLALCWLIGAGLPHESSLPSRSLTVILVSLIACQIIFMHSYVAAASNELTALYSKLKSAQSQTQFCAVYENYLRKSWDEPHRTGLDLLLTNHATVPRLPYHLYLERQSAAPIFQTGILDYNGGGSIEDQCNTR